MKHVVIYTDGSCVNNGHATAYGGWAALLIYNGHEKMISGGFQPNIKNPITNNKMEIMAAIQALDALKEPCNVTLVTDSQYTINGATGQTRRKVNKELWAKLDLAMKRHSVTWQWVRGHDISVENNKVDAEAQLQTKLIARKMLCTEN